MQLYSPFRECFCRWFFVLISGLSRVFLVEGERIGKCTLR